MDKSSKTKFIFVTGGVVSSLGKGLAAASLAASLMRRLISSVMCGITWTVPPR